MYNTRNTRTLNCDLCVNKLCEILLQRGFFMADSNEDDLVAHYSADVGCPTGLQGVAAPYCADYVLLL